MTHMYSILFLDYALHSSTYLLHVLDYLLFYFAEGSCHVYFDSDLEQFSSGFHHRV